MQHNHNNCLQQLRELVNDNRCEYVLSNLDRDFIDMCRRSSHVHWPLEWCNRIAEIHETMVSQ